MLEPIGTRLEGLGNLWKLVQGAMQVLERPSKVHETPLACAWTSLECFPKPVGVFGRRWEVLGPLGPPVLDTFGHFSRVYGGLGTPLECV